MSRILFILTVLSLVVLIITNAKYIDQCSPVETFQPKDIHKNCTSFGGCLNLDDRKTYLDPTSNKIQCAFMALNDLDIISHHFSADKKCRIVVYSTIFYAYDKIYNPPHVDKIAKDVCFVLIVDRKTMQHASSLLSDIFLDDNSPWLIFFLRNPPDPNPGRAVKLVKLAGPRLFPNADWIIYHDAKAVLIDVPYVLFDNIDKEAATTGIIPMGFSKHPKSSRSVEDEGLATFARLKSIHDLGKDSYYERNVNDLSEQMRVYKEEHFFDEGSPGAKPGFMVDSWVMIYRNSNCVKRFLCAWSSECQVFSHREQMSHHYIQVHLNMTSVYFDHPHIEAHFEFVGHIENHLTPKVGHSPAPSQ